MQIAVVGCGWLGLPLALSLQASGHKVVATCRSQQKANELKKLGLAAEKFELGDTLADNHLASVFASKVLILNIPVGRKHPKTESFAKHMQALISHAANSQIQNLIFISTTSVYGKVNGIVTEQTPTHPQTQSGQINLAVEGFVSEYFTDRSTIIRPAGLIGENRHPANYLAGKTDLPNPDDMVNLVHQDDVVCAIQTVIKKELWGQTLHLSALEHPTRAQYYIWAANKLGLNPPSFVKGVGVDLGKKVDATKSLQLLGLTLRYPSPFDMIGQ
jgi:nucleoside-diphosphate-sugar epimerase